MTPVVHHGDCLDVLAEMPDASVDAIVCDPPYGLSNTDPAHVVEALTQWATGNRAYVPTGRGFMGKEWDAFVPPPAVWDECFRVLKPGGHLLSFAGSRTFDLMTLSIRFAGFDIRDSIAWLYGSGFPKSLDVSKAIDKVRDDKPEILRVTAFLRAARDAAGFSNGQVDAALGVSGMCDHWCRKSPLQAAVPTWEQWQLLRHLLAFNDEMDAEVWRLNGRKGIPGEAFQSREVIGRTVTPFKVDEAVKRVSSYNPTGSTITEDGYRYTEHTAPATPAAQQWTGWGTALKPAFEPIVVARKPLIGTVAANVLAHGTGALNIDACRVSMSDDDRAKIDNMGGFGASGWTRADGTQRDTLDAAGRSGPLPSQDAKAHAGGRWPTNVVLDEAAAGELDEQSGPRAKGGKLGAGSGVGTDGARTYGRGVGGTITTAYDDEGGASRFFPVFKYQAKAPTRERPSYVKDGAGTGRVTGLGGKVRQCNVCQTRAIESGAKEPSCGHGDYRWEEPTTDVGNKVAHPTVKPLDLMRWLVRLVTPAGGTVLDPFAGSGATLEAALLEGFHAIGIERDADYLPLIRQRITRSTFTRTPVTVPATAAAEALTLFDTEEPA